MKENVSGLFKVKNIRIIKVLWLAVFCVLAFSLSPLSSAQAAAIWYVDAAATGVEDGTTWATAYDTIQEAIDDPATVAGDDIWVREGTYTLNTQIDVDEEVSIYGGFIGTEPPGFDPAERDWENNVTTVDGNDAAYHCFFMTDDATIDGFTITGGLANGGDIDDLGAGIYVDECSATIANCSVELNTAVGGGGIYLLQDSSPDMITMITNCIFDQNNADEGGAIFDDNSISTIITNCTFFDNVVPFSSSLGRGGGIYNLGTTESIITNCVFSGNSTNHHGGAIANNRSPSTITNCTFSGNHSDNQGGAIYNFTTNPDITNCILWGDTADIDGNEIYNENSSPVVSYSDIEGCGGSGSGWDPLLGTDGGGNIEDNPLFAGGLDYHITAGSLAIDAGDNTALPADLADLNNNGNTTEEIPFDLDYNPRRSGVDTVPIVDMGAYELLAYTVTVHSPGAGSGGDTDMDGDNIVYHGDSITITPNPDPFYSFNGWTGAPTGQENDDPLTIASVTGDMDITAIFAIDTHTVTVHSPGAGSGGDTDMDGDNIVNHGDPITITPNPDPFYSFNGWTGAPTGQENDDPLIIASVTGDMDITAIFAIDTYTVTVHSPGAGSGGNTDMDGDNIVNHGDPITITPNPDPFYSFNGWTGAPTGQENDDPLTIASVTGDMDITANFAIDTHTVTVHSPGAGSGGDTDMDGDNIVNHGDPITITPNPDPFYHFNGWTGAPTGQENDDPLIIASVTGDMDITANFAIDTFTVTFVPGANGSITGELLQENVPYGGSCTEVTAVPDTNHHLVDWTDPGGFSSTENPLTVNNVLSDMTITANFAINTYPVGDELALDFGGLGLWDYDGTTWMKISVFSPDEGMAGWSGGLAMDYGGLGLWNYDGTTWMKISASSPECMTGWANGLAMDFGGLGLWNFDGTTWMKISGSSPEGMAGWSGGLAMDFGGLGLWNFDGTTWMKISSSDVEDIADWANGLAMDFGVLGLWNFDGTTWMKISGSSPEDIAGWSGGLAMDYGGLGLWNFDGTTWMKISGSSTEGMTGWANGLAMDFGVLGLWNFDGTTWMKISGSDVEDMDDVDLF